MKKISSTMNAINKGIVENIRRDYGYLGNLKMPILPISKRNVTENGIFYEIDQILNTTHLSCAVEYYVYEYVDIDNDSSLLRLMNGAFLSEYSLSDTTDDQTYAKSERRMVVINLEHFGIDTPDHRCSNIEMSEE